ncbi:TPA: hypothetical protein ACIARM_004403 [Salmonella enterica subsp. enterica serovar Javiana]
MKLTTYQGKPCKKCGSTERYTSDKRCVACRHARNAAAWKKEAEERQQKQDNFESMTVDEKKAFLLAEMERRQRQTEYHYRRKLQLVTA